jgi:hypothetical protein
MQCVGTELNESFAKPFASTVVSFHLQVMLYLQYGRIFLFRECLLFVTRLLG